MISLKVVLVGDAKVGKSCILNRLVHGTFDKNTPATIGAAFMAKIIQTPNETVRLQLWDTAGQEKFRSLAPMYYRSAAVAVLVYDVTSRESLVGLEEWAAEINDKTPQHSKLVIIGNKIDLEDQRCISTQQGKEFAEQIGAVIHAETSAKTGEGINEVFAKIAELEITQDDIVENPKELQSKNESGCSC
ncbi:small GTP-binding protein [Histomonas meleagridis]|uniref:small GTP-binding protein n=1 Tax=Histomonas meleagridis TaxID=135588 RepID=UPI0035599658|nr:small GTP-binding protein [Histomonas meleagridis]KAH0799367.1 small GTP-binding protein [Histomonas meleagridis]